MLEIGTSVRHRKAGQWGLGKMLERLPDGKLRSLFSTGQAQS
jgi:hypothetical protein